MASQIPEKKKWTQAVKDECRKIRSFGWKDGIGYVWDYYKWFIIIFVTVVLSVIVINTGNDIRELTLHVSFTAEAYYDYSEYLDEYDEKAGLTAADQYSYFDPVTRYGTYAGYQNSNWINTQQLEVMLVDKTWEEHSMKMGCFYDLTEFLPEDMVKALEGKFVWYENEELGVAGYFAVDIADLFGYGEGSNYEDGLYYIVPENTLHPDAAITFLRYLMDNPPKEFVPAEDDAATVN